MILFGRGEGSIVYSVKSRRRERVKRRKNSVFGPFSPLFATFGALKEIN